MSLAVQISLGIQDILKWLFDCISSASTQWTELIYTNALLMKEEKNDKGKNDKGKNC